ncbi:MAG TPA: hypothetical protein DCR39_00760 [Nitrospiraceae bacterium]|nr:hypothetical protein [Nitrospiraceae bacterium]
MEKPDDKLKELMKSLADTISQVFSGNLDIKHALSMIEKEGYHVDMILASVTRLSRKQDDQSADIDLSDFDKSFLKNIRIRLDEADIV